MKSLFTQDCQSNDFGEALRKARTDKRVTLRVLSKHVGLSISHLLDIENNRKSPPMLDIVEKIEEYLGINDGRLSGKLNK